MSAFNDLDPSFVMSSAPAKKSAGDARYQFPRSIHPLNKCCPIQSQPQPILNAKTAWIIVLCNSRDSIGLAANWYNIIVSHYTMPK